MNWKRMLAYISGSVDEELLLQNDYLATEIRILKNQIKGRLRLTDAERVNLAEIGRRLGRKALEEVAQIVRPETILGWHRKLIAMKFDGSKNRSAVLPSSGAPHWASHIDLNQRGGQRFNGILARVFLASNWSILTRKPAEFCV